jgi:hypothetical protein
LEARNGLALKGHTVTRVSLGDFDLKPGQAEVALQVAGSVPGRAAIGVDQWMLTPVEKEAGQ